MGSLWVEVVGSPGTGVAAVGSAVAEGDSQSLEAAGHRQGNQYTVAAMAVEAAAGRTQWAAATGRARVGPGSQSAGVVGIPDGRYSRRPGRSLSRRTCFSGCSSGSHEG